VSAYNIEKIYKIILMGNNINKKTEKLP